MKLLLNKENIVKIKSYALIVCALFAALGFMPLTTAQAGDEPVEVTVLYVANSPNIDGDIHMPSYAQIATLVANERANNENLIFLHGGDSIAPSILSSLDKGAHIIDLLNSLNPDLLSVGKREFTYGKDVLILRSQEALFPFVSNNTIDEDTGKPFPYFEDHIIFNFNGLKIGVTASTTKDSKVIYSAEKVEFFDMAERTKAISTKMREQGVDVVILLYDNVDEDLEILIDEGYVDIVIEESFHVEGKVFAEEKGIFHHDLYTGYISKIKLIYDENADQKLTIKSFERLDVKTYEYEPETQELIQSYLEPLGLLFDMELGKTLTPFNTFRVDVRSQENAFANFIADTIRDISKTDIAIINGGSVRGNKIYKAGDVLTRRDIQTELPFRNTLVTIEATGADILAAIETGLICMETKAGCGTHFSNMKIVYDQTRPKGNRIISALIADEDVDMERKYSIATTAYIAKGGDGLTMFKGSLSDEKKINNALLWEIISNYIFQNKTISPVLDGRFKSIN